MRAIGYSKYGGPDVLAICELPEVHAVPEGGDGLADGAVLNELVIPTVRDGGAFMSLRGFEGEPRRDIRFLKTLVF